MNIKVESCWAGNSNFYFRLTAPNGERLGRVQQTDGAWDRKAASEALNIVVSLTGARRKNVRFDHI